MTVPEQMAEAMKACDWLQHYINEYCIYRVAPGEDKLPRSHGHRGSTMQFYLRRGLCNRQFLTLVGQLFWLRFAEAYRQQPFQISGLETAATPLMIGLVMTAPFPVNGFITRKTCKPYGLRNRFEGVVNPQLPVM